MTLTAERINERISDYPERYAELYLVDKARDWEIVDFIVDHPELARELKAIGFDLDDLVDREVVTSFEINPDLWGKLVEAWVRDRRAFEKVVDYALAAWPEGEE